MIEPRRKRIGPDRDRGDPMDAAEKASICGNQKAPTCRNLPPISVMKLPHVQTRRAAEY